MENKAILTAEEEQKLIQPIDEYVGKIQEKINGLRADGTDQIISLNNHMAVVRENANYSKAEKAAIIAEDKKALLAAKAVEQQNKPEVKKLIDDAVKYLDEWHYNVCIYNIPLCLLPDKFHKFAQKSISDWKNDYTDICQECKKKEMCCGLFTTSIKPYVGLKAIQ